MDIIKVTILLAFCLIQCEGTTVQNEERVECQNLGDAILGLLDFHRRVRPGLDAANSYVRLSDTWERAGVNISDRDGVRRWACQLAEATTMEKLKEVVGDEQVARRLYSEYVQSSQYVGDSQLVPATIAFGKALEGTRTLGVSGWGASKFETYTCEDLFNTFWDLSMATLAHLRIMYRHATEEYWVEVGQETYGIQNMFDEEEVKIWACKILGAATLDEVATILNISDDVTAKFDSQLLALYMDIEGYSDIHLYSYQRAIMTAIGSLPIGKAHRF